MSEPVWLSTARKYIGQKEVKGAKHNPTILKWWIAIRAPFTDDETPWCAGFVGGVLEECGIKSSRAAYARSYLTWGQPLRYPVLGAILVFERGPRNGHVGFYVGEDKDTYYVLGGNQGDTVSITRIAKARLLGSRFPLGYSIPLTGPTLVNKGGAVSKNEA